MTIKFPPEIYIKNITDSDLDLKPGMLLVRNSHLFLLLHVLGEQQVLGEKLIKWAILCSDLEDHLWLGEATIFRFNSSWRILEKRERVSE